MNLFKAKILQVFICLSIIAVFSGCQKKQGADKTPPKNVIAQIDNTVITMEGFNEVLKRLLPDSDANISSTGEEQKELKKNILFQIIEEELILNEAKRIGIEVLETDVSKEIEGIKKDYQDDVFTNTIVNRYGSMEKWKEEIRRKILISKTIDSAVHSRIQLKDEAIAAYYREHKGEFKIPERVKMRVIILPIEEDANKTLKRLRNGEDFTKVAKEVSSDRDSPNAGEFTYYNRGELPKEFEDVVFSIPLARASEVVRTTYGYNIFRVEERTRARDLSFREVKDAVAKKIKMEMGNSAFQEWIKNLKDNAKIEIEEKLL